MLACRNAGKAAAAAAEINAQVRANLAAAAAAGKATEYTGGVAIPMQLDLAEFASVRRFADSFTASHSRLHVFVANAGLNGVNTETVDGFNTVFQVNYLSHFLLLQLLLPTMAATGVGVDRGDAASAKESFARVVLLSSVMQHVAPGNYSSSSMPLSKPVRFCLAILHPTHIFIIIYTAPNCKRAYLYLHL